jgi:hypothetical protein
MNRFLPLVAYLLATACAVTDRPAANSPQVQLLTSPAEPGSGEPSLFRGADSTVYLSWIEKQENKATLKFSELQDRKWSTPTIIASGNDWFVNWADFPTIAVNKSSYIAHFLKKSGDGTYAYDVNLTQSGDQGKTWTTPVILHDDKKQAEHGFVTMLPYGDNFFITWLDGRNTVMEGMDAAEHHGHFGAMSLRAAIVDTEGNKINEWELDNKTCDCCQTTAAITPGGPVVVYRDRSDDEIRDMSIVRLVDGQWSEPKSIHEDGWKIEGCPVNGPSAAVAGNSLAVAWFSAVSQNARVDVAFSTDGGKTFVDPIRIDEGNPLGRVEIVMTDEKTAIVCWMEGARIMITKVRIDGTKENPVTIATSSDSRSSGFPQMTLAGDQLIFAWTDDAEKVIKVASVIL